VEIKGVSSIRQIPVLVHNEALRQRSLLAIRDVLAARGVTAESIDDRSQDVTDIVRGTGWRYLAKTIEQGGRAAAVPLPGFEGLVNTPTQPHTRFLKEFSDRVRVVACISSLPNLLCSTSEMLTLSSVEWDRIEKSCGVSHGTPVMVVWGEERDVRTAVAEILLRARDACTGVPDETRQSLPDGTNGFERILPGPSRMYPDTDLPPIVIDKARTDRIRQGLQPTPWERLGILRAAGVGEDLARRLSIHPAYALFIHLLPRLGDGRLAPTGLASLLLDRDPPRPLNVVAAGDWWEELVDDLAAGRVLPEGVWADGDAAIPAVDPRVARGDFEAALAALPAGLPEDRAKRERTVMGRVMERLRGRVPGRTVAEWVKEATL
jgi:glutamyl-tRNA(Gln) amidotransferase subunit E